MSQLIIHVNKRKPLKKQPKNLKEPRQKLNSNPKRKEFAAKG